MSIGSFGVQVTGSMKTSTSTSDYAASFTNINDSSQGILVRTTDNDGSLYIARFQSSPTSVSEAYIDRLTLAKNGTLTASGSIRVDGSYDIRVGTTTLGSVLNTNLELVGAGSNTQQAAPFLQFTDGGNQRYWTIQQDASFNLATFHYNAGWAKVGYQTPAGTWTNSDERRKKDIETLNYGITEVLQLEPKLFRFVKEENNSQKSLGFIAQQVLPIIPEAVQTDMDGDTEYYAMNYSNIVPVLTKAIQEQQAIIDGLIARIEALENN
jgi:hypothetical protein